MAQFVAHPNISAINYHYFPEQEGRNALADVLYGDVAPSNRLPFLTAKNVNENDLSSYFNSIGREDTLTTFRCLSPESLPDYRFSGYNKIEPL